MTIQELIDKVKTMDYPQQLDKGYGGECPCFWYYPIINGKRIEIHGHCWRTCKKCAYNGLHISGKLPLTALTRIAKAFKVKLDRQKWHGDYDLVIKSTLKVKV